MTNSIAIPTDLRSFGDKFAPTCRRNATRLHWIVVNAIGLRPSDIIHAVPDFPLYPEVAKQVGASFSHREDGATITILSRVPEADLLSRVNRLAPGNRILAFNRDRDIDAMSLRSFEMVTACLFDQESGLLVRVFDARPRPVADYLHVELIEHSDASLAIQAQRIASLR